jgi:hypothetical protein
MIGLAVEGEHEQERGHRGMAAKAIELLVLVFTRTLSNPVPRPGDGTTLAVRVCGVTSPSLEDSLTHPVGGK